MSQSFIFDTPEHVTVGTLGEPGRRLFLFQAQAGPTMMTLKMEKQQVGALATYLGDLLQEAPRPGHVPEGAELDLRSPAEVAWNAGSLAAAYDEVADRVVIEIEEMEDPNDMMVGGYDGEARLHITREQAAALAIRGTSLVEAGRPPCPLCGHPIDPEGHACPRTNGNRPPEI